VREHAAAYAALRTHGEERPGPGARDRPLGEALQHIERRYVVARNDRGLVVVDACRALRHVAAKGLAAALDNDSVASRPLLVPVAVAIDEAKADLLESRGAFLDKLGFDLRRVAPESVSCRGIPTALATALPEKLVFSVADALTAEGLRLESPDARSALFDAVLGECDLTAGWSWDRDAMDDLLRQLERYQVASRVHGGEAVWRQLSGDDIAALL
jgi:DNA mismatch repair protein MutL